MTKEKNKLLSPEQIIRNLNLEIARLNGVIEGMEKAYYPPYYIYTLPMIEYKYPEEYPSYKFTCGNYTGITSANSRHIGHDYGCDCPECEAIRKEGEERLIKCHGPKR